MAISRSRRQKKALRYKDNSSRTVYAEAPSIRFVLVPNFILARGDGTILSINFEGSLWRNTFRPAINHSVTDMTTA